MSPLTGRKLLTRRELPLLLLLVLAAGGLLLWTRLAPAGAVAVVEAEGRELARRELRLLSKPETLTAAGAGGLQVTVELSPQGARVIEAGCPDKSCQRTGWLTQAGDCAVCLPARVVLRLEGGPAGADAETY